MHKFYFLLWFRWACALSLKSLFLGSLLAAFFVLFIYIKKGMPELNDAIWIALWDLFCFGFAFTWSLAVLVALFTEIKGIFLHCYGAYKLELLSCKENEIIENIGYVDTLKVWRKWLMLLIWLVGSIFVFAVIIQKLLSPDINLSEWFNIFWLYLFVLVGAYFSFILLASRCKKVKIVRC